MKKALSSRDLELLSAYLDQQIKAGERQKVETRLREDAEFRQTYEQMRQTRQLLRSLPAVHAPRNFTLSPAQVRVIPSRRFIPIFGMASAIASFLLVLVFLSDILFFSPRTAMAPSLQSGNVPAVAMQSNPAEKSAVENYAMETATDSALSKAAPAGARSASPTETVSAPSAFAPMSTPQPEATPAGQNLMMNTAPLTTTATISTTAQTLVAGSLPTHTLSADQVFSTTPTLIEPVPPVPTPTSQEIPSLTERISPWMRWIEALLVLVALSTGVLFILFKRGFLH